MRIGRLFLNSGFTITSTSRLTLNFFSRKSEAGKVSWGKLGKSISETSIILKRKAFSSPHQSLEILFLSYVVEKIFNYQSHLINIWLTLGILPISSALQFICPLTSIHPYPLIWFLNHHLFNVSCEVFFAWKKNACLTCLVKYFANGRSNKL